MRRNTDIYQRTQNAGLNALKVVMILFVIFIHENPTSTTHGELAMWWHRVVVVAVPVFFTLSGYFFFRGMGSMTLDVYKAKILKRVKTLFVPYMIWNCMPVLFVVAGNLYSMIFRHKSPDAMIAFLSGLWQEGLWHIWWDKTSGTMPFDSPLWYVRDLMILCLLSPLVYWSIQKTGWGVMAFLVVLYMLQLPFPIGLSLTGLMFFSLGAIFALKDISLNYVSGGGRIIVYLLTCILFIGVPYFEYGVFYQLFILLSCCAWILLFYGMTGKWVMFLAKLSECVFFTLALHNIIILANVGKTLNKLIGHDALSLSYWLAPFLTLAVCILIYLWCKKQLPQLLSVLSGGR